MNEEKQCLAAGGIAVHYIPGQQLMVGAADHNRVYAELKKKNDEQLSLLLRVIQDCDNTKGMFARTVPPGTYATICQLLRDNGIDSSTPITGESSVESTQQNIHKPRPSR